MTRPWRYPHLLLSQLCRACALITPISQRNDDGLHKPAMIVVGSPAVAPANCVLQQTMCGGGGIGGSDMQWGSWLVSQWHHHKQPCRVANSPFDWQQLTGYVENLMLAWKQFSQKKKNNIIMVLLFLIHKVHQCKLEVCFSLWTKPWKMFKHITGQFLASVYARLEWCLDLTVRSKVRRKQCMILILTATVYPKKTNIFLFFK